MMMLAVVLVLSACSGSSDTSGTKKHQNSQSTSSGSKSEKKDQKKDQKDNTDKKASTKSKEHTGFKQKKPKYKMTKDYYIKPTGDADPKVVLLTIDDAPEDHAVEMAKKLKKLDAKAIFYVNKIYVDKDDGKQKLKKLAKMGFPVGNHTATHPNLGDLSKKKQRKELVPVYDQIKNVTGQKAKFFRAPHGVNTDVSNQLAKDRDVLVMNWSYGYDFKSDYEDADKLKHVMLHPEPAGLLRNGAILLMHDRDWTNEALKGIVKGLRDKGYKILDPALLKTPQSPK